MKIIVKQECEGMEEPIMVKGVSLSLRGDGMLAERVLNYNQFKVGRYMKVLI